MVSGLTYFVPSHTNTYAHTNTHTHIYTSSYRFEGTKEKQDDGKGKS